MTEYAVTVNYTGDIIVEAESADAARAEVEQQLPHRTPDSDFYLTEIVGVQEES